MKIDSNSSKTAPSSSYKMVKNSSWSLLLLSSVLVAILMPKMTSAYCPSPRVMEKLHLDKYLGTWYEIERTYNPHESSSRKYQKTDIIATPNTADGYNVLWNTTWNVNGKTKAMQVKGIYNAKEKSAKLKVKPSPWLPKQHYWVLETDYDNYAIVWSCAEFYLSHMEFIWIFSRERTLRPEHRAMIYCTLTENDIELEDLIMVDQCNC